MTLTAPPEQDIIILGVSGDLARRKLLPSLYNLVAQDLLPSAGKIIGMSRTNLGQEGFINLAREAINEFSRNDLDESVWDSFKSRLIFFPLNATGYALAKECCEEGERVVYLSVPPWAVPGIIVDLHNVGLVEGTRLILEKPFGNDLTSAVELERILHKVFDESQIFRIDHYLGKETVQNILAFRFANSMFERVWNRDAIQHVQITMAESMGIEGRGNFYEGVGALRDVVQNHVFQILSLLTMEPPSKMTSEDIRNEKEKLFYTVQALQPASTVRGQYSAGNIDGERVPGYIEEEGVEANSTTETFVATKLMIDNWRWAGVPFYLRTGKRLARRTTEIVITFKEVPLYLFEDICPGGEIEPNRLFIHVQPDEGMVFTFQAKQPGPDMRIQEVSMDFSYRDSFGKDPAEAYEWLLLDAMEGDRTLFLRADSVLQSWRIVQPALDNPSPIHTYPAGTWGPPEADDLIKPYVWLLDEP